MGYEAMWRDLGLNMEEHDKLLGGLVSEFKEAFLERKGPKGMDYFYWVVSEAHGRLIEELLEVKRNGGKVVGGFCAYVPEEVVVAAGGRFVGVCGGTQFSIPYGEGILPRNLCPLIKSAFGFMVGNLCPYYKVLDLLVGETTCDGKKKAWEIFDYYMDVYKMELPQMKRDVDREAWFREVVLFKGKMEEISGRKIGEDELEEGIRLINKKRRALIHLYQLRKRNPSPISGLDALLIAQVAYYDEPGRFAEKLEKLCQELEEGNHSYKGPRILVSGCPMPLPFWKVHRIIEGSGAIVVCEESCVGTRYFWNLVEERVPGVEGKLRAISDRYLNINCSCFTPNSERVEGIVRFSREYKVDGVIHFNLQFCTTYSMEFIKVKKRLEEEGIPLLEVETDYGLQDTGQLKTRIEAFVESITY